MGKRSYLAVVASLSFAFAIVDCGASELGGTDIGSDASVLDGAQQGDAINNFSDAGDAGAIDANSRDTSTQDASSRDASGPAPGTLDTSFGDGGIVSVDGLGPGTSVITLTDGRIVVQSGDGSQGMPNTTAAVAMLHGDGTFDTSFGDAGVAFFPDFLTGGGIFEQSGELLMLAGTHNGPAVVHIQLDGTIDTTVGDGGAITGFVPECGIAIFNNGAIDTSGRLVAATGTSQAYVTNSSCQLVARYQASGALDTTFGDPDDAGARLGYTLRSYGSDEAWTNVTTFDGGVATVGVSDDNGGVFVYSADGTFEKSLPAGTNCQSVIAASSNSFVVGCSEVMLRVLPDGGLDTTFGNNGYSQEDPPIGATGLPFHIVAQPDGKLLLAGDGANPGFAYLGRFSSNGIIDAQFGEGGVAGGNGTEWYAVTLQSDGKIIVAGTDQFSGGHLVVARYWP